MQADRQRDPHTHLTYRHNGCNTLHPPGHKAISLKCWNKRER